MQQHQFSEKEQRQKQDNLYARHAFSFALYVNEYKHSLDRLQKDEEMIRDLFGKDGPLPPQWQDKINRDRQAWQDSWTLKGRELNRSAYQQKEDYNGNIDKQLEAPGGKSLPVTMSELNAADSVPAGDAFRQRRQEWQELRDEQEAVYEYYAYTEERSPPPATTRRMEKQQAAFAERWNVTLRQLEASDEPTLSAYDLSHQAESRHDLLVAHYAIARHYEHTKNMPVPETARDRILFDCEDFLRQQADDQTLKAAQGAIISSSNIQPADDAAQEEKNHRFREHLQAVRDAQAQSKPRIRP